MVKRNELTAMQANALSKGKHADGQGLWLVKSHKDAGKWMLRLVVAGKRREMGLGRGLTYLLQKPESGRSRLIECCVMG